LINAVGSVALLQGQQQDRSDSTDNRQTTPTMAATGTEAGAQQHQPDLSRVGLVLWQSGYVLSDFLLLRLPQLQAGRHSSSSTSSSSMWAGARVLELGCGAGTVGMFLALAGAQVRL
jgi:predicted nicotinamide N-methyase